ncbi:MAG: ATP-binding protein, partial [Alphaproteobacteria bacterium]
VKFTPDGGRIALKATFDDYTGACVLSVTDTGIGIAPEDIPKVMEPFRQADNTLSRKYEGSGLGLPLVKSFADIHGATMDVESDVGTGTTVTITFPAERTRSVASLLQRQSN